LSIEYQCEQSSPAKRWSKFNSDDYEAVIKTIKAHLGDTPLWTISAPSSSAPIKRLYPATSAASIAASRRSTRSLLKMHLGSGNRMPI